MNTSPAIEHLITGESSPNVAVVILNYNGRHFLEQFIPFLLKTTYPAYRIIVADNASSDQSVFWLKKTYPSIECIVFNENLGFAGGYNAALKRVHADYYVLLNSDVEVTAGWIEPIISLMEGNKRIAACQPKLLSFHHRNKFEYAGAAGGWIDNLGYPFARGRVFDYCETDTGQYDDAAPCFWATGAALFIRAEEFHLNGGFDPFFFAHQEEIDLCWRIQKTGKYIYCQPNSVVYHVGGGTLSKDSNQKIYLNFRNNLVMLHKNLSKTEKCFKIPLRLCLDGIAAIRYLLQGNAGAIPVILKAHWSYYKWAVKKNSSKPKISKSLSLNGKYRGSLIWQHFVKRKKTFDKIVYYK